MQFTTECIVLSRRNFAEADRLVTLYSKEYGKITVIAKGVRRPKSRKTGHLEPGTWCVAHIVKGKNLDILTEVIAKKSFGLDNINNEKTVQIYHFLEILNSLTPQNQKNEQSFRILLAFLDKTEKEENFNLLSTIFKIRLLRALGFFAPESVKKENVKKILKLLESESIGQIKKNQKITEQSYLNLLIFLDSIIEGISESKLKTKRFLNGPF